MNRLYHLLYLLLAIALQGMAQTLPAPPEGTGWSQNMIHNADLSTSDLSSFAVSGNGVTMKIVNRQGRKAIEVVSTDFKANSWDSQFFLRWDEPVTEGEQLYISFSYEAERNASCSTEAHSKPGSYNHWQMLGNIDFTTTWHTSQWNLPISAAQAGSNGFTTIAFDLNINQQKSNRFYFSDFKVHRLCALNPDCSQLIINEVQVANTDLYIDPSCNYGGWIELYNPGDADVYLGGIGISDDASRPGRFRLPASAGVVPAHGFRNVWFDHNAADGSYSDEAHCQVPFKLDMEGGDIILSDPQGQVIHSVSYPPAVPRCSYALTTDGGTQWGTTGTPTPQQSNAGADFATHRLEAPVVSRDGCVFGQGQAINFSVEIPDGATLRYTTDGSTPTATHGSTSVTGRFSTGDTRIYRFCLVQQGMLPSPVVTRSFICRQHDYYLPILSIATHPDNLFDPQIGLYVRGTNGISGRGQDTPCNWNRDWERPVNMEYLVPQQNTEGEVSFISVLNQEVGFEIVGGWSRGFGGATNDGFTWDAKSSFRLKTNKYYDADNQLAYPVFPAKPYNKYRAWHIRNGGNDDTHRTKDPILQQIVQGSGMDIDCQDYQPCHVFMDGLYLGMLNIRESSNKQYGYSNLGIDTDDMDQMENWGDVKVGDRVAWDQLQAHAAALATSHSASDYQAVCQLLDVDEFINYMAVQCYLGGSDWLPNNNNVKWYRSRSDDGRFRFVLFDLDSATDGDHYSMFAEIVDQHIGGEVGQLFSRLVQYDVFRRRFMDAMCLVEGSVMHPSRTDSISQRICDRVNQALTFENLQPGRDMIARVNARYQRQVVANLAAHPLYAGISQPCQVQVSSNIGTGQILLNGQRIPTDRFDGRLYDMDHQGIHLTAQAPAGYRFLGWIRQAGLLEHATTVVPRASRWEYHDQGSMDGQSWTRTDFDAAAHGWHAASQAPFGYGNGGSYPHEHASTHLDYGGNASAKRTTYYFRTKFFVDELPQPGDVLRLNYQVDDGFACYLNGQYAGGFRVSQSDTRYDFVTTDYAGSDPDEGSILLDAGTVQLGWNTLAVEVHNNSRSSSDIYWDCSLQLVSSQDIPTQVIGTAPTLCLADTLLAQPLSLVATWAPITDARERYESGASPVRINEVSAANDIYINEYNKKNDWVELYNTTDEDIDLSGMYLSDNAGKPQKWRIGSAGGSTIIPAHGTRIIWCDQLEPISQLHAPFRLDNADGGIVSIQAADGTWADRLTYLSQPRWHTYGRYPDGSNHATLLSLPTIDASNRHGQMDYTLYDPAQDPETAITLALAEGWNWTSHNLAEDIHLDRFGPYVQEVRGRDQQNTRDEQAGWLGGLQYITHAQGYRMYLQQATDITLRGQLFDASRPISLLAGWNWLGVPLANATALQAALQNYIPTEGDRIVGLEAFAIYESGSWHGPLTQLQPGQAYLVHAGRAQDFRWNDLSQPSPTRQHRYAAPQRSDMAPWDFNLHAHPSVMTLVAQLQADHLEAGSGYHVGAFCGDECRGVAWVEDDLLYMNIHGQEGDTLQFHLLDADGNLYTAQETASMHDLQGLGTTVTPHQLHFTGADVDDVIHDAMATGSRIISIQYYSLSGQRIAQPRGICVQRIHLADGTTRVQKVMAR